MQSNGSIPGAETVREHAVTTVTVYAPGAGGYGDPGDRGPAARERDRADGETSAGEG